MTTYTLLLSLLIGLSACSKSEFEYQTAYERSYRAWQDFKQSNNNSYSYTVRNSTWTGSSWQTSISVDQGRIVSRDFHYLVFNSFEIPTGGWTIKEATEIVDSLTGQAIFNSQTPEELLSKLRWTEKDHELGIHEISPAAELITMDDVYELAKNQWLAKRKDANFSFETKNNGIISSVGFVPEGCMDDCFFGIHIIDIKPR